MNIQKGDIPYLFEDVSEWRRLPNTLDHQIVWDYTLHEAKVTLSFEGDEMPVIIERVRRRQHYRLGDYFFVAYTVDEWQYLDHEQADYPTTMFGYHGYWVGETYFKGKPALQPEVALLLGFSNNLQITPAYIETISRAELLDLLDEVNHRLVNDDALAFNRPVPLGPPPDAPELIVDSLRRMRAQSGLLITRGRAAGLEFLMDQTGVVAENGGWRLLPEEIDRRQQLGLR